MVKINEKSEKPLKKYLRLFFLITGTLIGIFLVWGFFPWNSFQDSLPSAKIQDLSQQDGIAEVIHNYETIIHPILESKCSQCHTGTEHRPFFYYLPGISLFSKPYVDHEIREGRSEFEFTQGLPIDRFAAVMEFMMRIREVAEQDSMPPQDYRFVKPWHALTSSEREALSSWAQTGLESLNQFFPQAVLEDKQEIGDEFSDFPLEERIAKQILQACPLADPGDIDPRLACAQRLRNNPLLKSVMSDPFLWGQQKKPKTYQLSKFHTTRFNPRVWKNFYLSLFMFPGEYKIERSGDLVAIHLPYVFRDQLDSGEYPYPFWHSSKKWTLYNQARELILVLKKGKLVGGLRSVATKEPPVPMVSRVWNQQWFWKDPTTGEIQPETMLFENLFSKENPHIQHLDSSYRKMALGFQTFECMSCHSPNNAADMKMLELFSYPNQALSARHRIFKAIQENSMPPGTGIPDEIQRKTLLEMANEFKEAGDDAFRFENERVEDWMNRSLRQLKSFLTPPILHSNKSS